MAFLKAHIMLCKRLILFAVAVFLAGLGWQCIQAKDLRLTLPRRSELTPVQKLNREGVEAIRKRDYAKAEGLFYKAYLYDASDPFTLNNLGYISELEGKMDRAKKFYALAAEQNCNAVIDLSNAKQLQGKPMSDALTGLKDAPMRVNRMNVRAIDLLSQNRNMEAYVLLRKALALEPQNAFTLNNLGVAQEGNGDFQSALTYYDAAAASDSSASIVVTPDRSWRGKSVSKMAHASADRLRKKMQTLGNAETSATLLAFRGVSAINRNDWASAKRDFLQAYTYDPTNAFSLNNRGYVAEKEGDIETAQFFYSKARTADDASARVGLATQTAAQGIPVAAVAADNRQKMTAELSQYSRAARQQKGPIELIPRGASSNNKSVPPTKTSPPIPPNSRPQSPTPQ